MQLLPPFIRKKLEGRRNLQKILGNTGWLFADKIIRLIVELFVGVWIARYLRPEQFGLYSYAIAFVAMFSAFATLGLDRIVVRDILQEPTEKEEILGTTFSLRLFGGFCTLILSIITIVILRPHDNLAQWLVTIIALKTVFQAFDAIDLWFQSQVNSKYTVIAKDIALFVVTLLKIVLISVQAPLIAFAWMVLLEIVLTEAGLMLTYRMNGYRLQFKRFNRSRARRLIQDGFPLMLSSIAVTIYMRIDQIMLGEMTTTREVGIYSVAVNLSEAWYFVPTAIATSVFPAIIASKKISEELYYKRIYNLFRFMAGLSYLVAIPVTLFSHSLVNSIFGETYQEAGVLVSFYIWSGLFVALGVARSLWITVENLTYFSFFSTGLGAILNIILNFLLIPNFESLGATIATVISQSLAAFWTCFMYKKSIKIGILMFRSLVLF